MIIHCKKCDINWARLWEQQMDSSDETVEFCPKCGTDMFLEPGNDIVAFIKCPITGKITNAETGEQYKSGASAVSLTDKTVKVKVWDESYEEFKAREEAAEDACIVAASFMGNIPPKRKFHFE